MAVRRADALKDAMLDAYESHISTAPVLTIRTGAPPTNLTDADTGTLLATITCPSDWMAASSGGSKVLAGTWSTTGVAAGTAGHYRLKTSGGTIKEDGTVTATGGGGDLTLSNTSIAVDQAVSITTFTRTI